MGPVPAETTPAPASPPGAAPAAEAGELPGEPGAATLEPALAARLKRDAAGLVCAVVQQHDTREVLMVAWMDDTALALTLSTGRATYWSRSRGALWRKGDTSGHVQHVKRVSLDCDGDALLVEVDQVGAACHTGERTCFDAAELPVRAGTGA
ncbi:phosphoribosyl-AMP cyclohydrolase [Kineococcus auxinigenes]|uniref:phosphoribosyl-AMP cyclohydrolase n=1 Tax=unclassified Kineococcus TaxID=2621656 RepID=UPI003D7D0BEF